MISGLNSRNASQRKNELVFSEDELLASVCRKSYYRFVQEMWDTVVAETPVWNWHMQVLCDRVQFMLERVFRNEAKLYDLVVNVPPGMSKPVWEEEPVLMADGKYRKLKNVQVGDFVIGKSGRPCRVTAVHVQGDLPCVKVYTHGGRRLVAALDHPVLTVNGWRAAGDLVPFADRVAVMHKAKVTTSSPQDGYSDADFTFAGYLIGDGHIHSRGYGCQFTNCTPEYLQEFQQAAQELKFGLRTVQAAVNDKTSVTTYTVNVKNGPDGRLKRTGQKRGCGIVTGPGHVKSWLDKTGLTGKRSADKFVPAFVWNGTDEQVAKFIAAYFHCDGGVGANKPGQAYRRVSFGSISRRLLVEVQRLLLRLGMSFRLVSRVAKRGFKYKRTLVGYKSYVLVSTDQDTVAKFAERIPVMGYKREQLGRPSRSRFDEAYVADEVVKVRKAGNLPCRCLTVEGDKSFVASDIVVHNSLIFTVMLPAWAWTRMASFKFIGASYSYPLAQELSVKTRDVVQSEKYQRLFPEVQLREDQNTKGLFKTTKGGGRFAVGVNGSITGFHAHWVGIDDPLDPNQAASPADLAAANRWIRETLPSRKVDKRVAPTALIMQRLHQNDPTAQMVRRGKIFRITLPATTEDVVRPARLKEYYKDGLLDPVRLPKEVLEETEKEMGEVPYAAQYRQRPTPPGGAMFKVKGKWTDEKTHVRPLPPGIEFTRMIRFWDKAGSQGGRGPFTSGVLMGEQRNGPYWVLDVIRFRLEVWGREAAILETAKMDERRWGQVIVGLEQEPGSGGKESLQATVRRLHGFHVWWWKVDSSSGGKELRAEPWATQVNAGNVVLLHSDVWNDDFVQEHVYFPYGRYLDQVDAAAGAFQGLSGAVVTVGALQ